LAHLLLADGMKAACCKGCLGTPATQSNKMLDPEGGNNSYVCIENYSYESPKLGACTSFSNVKQRLRDTCTHIPEAFKLVANREANRLASRAATYSGNLDVHAF
jgi:hypothetical protein